MEEKKEAARAAIIAVIEANGLTFREAHEVIHELDQEVWKAAFKSAFSGQFVVEQISESRQQSL